MWLIKIVDVLWAWLSSYEQTLSSNVSKKTNMFWLFSSEFFTYLIQKRGSVRPLASRPNWPLTLEDQKSTLWNNLPDNFWCVTMWRTVKKYATSGVKYTSNCQIMIQLVTQNHFCPTPSQWMVVNTSKVSKLENKRHHAGPHTLKLVDGVNQEVKRRQQLSSCSPWGPGQIWIICVLVFSYEL